MNPSIPQEIQDSVNVMIVAFKDFKASKGSAVIQDELPLIMKLFGELNALKADLNAKGALEALDYLVQQIEALI